jgi:Ca2+-binding RTX toxin-like protein
VFNLGDGRDVINENGDSSADVDRLVFGAGIAASDISISRSGNDLVLKHVNGQDQVTISRWFSTTDTRFQVERIEFVDGTLWAREYVSASSLQLTGSEGDDVLTGVTAAFNQLLSGLGGNDTLTGGAGNDRLEGGKGNDVLAGGNGGDIYVFNLGDGRDVINENGDSSADVDRLVFGAGITASDISISRSGNDLVLKHVNGQDQVTISRWFSSTDTRFQVERIEFVDGTVWARTDVSAPLLQMTGSEGDDVLTGVTAAFNQVLSGLGGNDTLTGGAGNDRLEGGKGNDILAGGNGGDTYVFNLGDGRDVINENGDSSADVDRLVFGGGIASSDISISRSGNDLVLNHGNGDDRVTVNNWFLSTSARYRIERLEFADGFVWTSDQVTSQASTNGNDSLLGSSGNDRLQGGKGNDYLQGTEGNDVYIFSAGDGQDIINNASTSPGDVDVLRFDGLTPQNLWLSRENDNLVIDALGSDERVTISDWYKSPAQQLDVIQAGSVALYASAVDNLVSAMASFGAPAGGEVNLTQAQRDQINLVIATNWQ